MSPRRILLGSIAVLAVVLAVVSVAWACVPGGNTLTLDKSEGPPGTKVMVSGEGWQALNTIEIYWDSGVKLGEKLSGADGSFSVEVTIPAAATVGDHVVRGEHTGAHAGHSPAAAPFKVLGTDPGGGGGGGGGSGGGGSGGGGSGGGSDGGGSTPTPVTPQAPPPTRSGQPSPTPPSNPDTTRRARAKAIASCKKKYSARRARTASKKRKLAKKRAACIRKAKKRFPVGRAASFTSPLLRPFV